MSHIYLSGVKIGPRRITVQLADDYQDAIVSEVKDTIGADKWALFNTSMESIKGGISVSYDGGAPVTYTDVYFQYYPINSVDFYDMSVIGVIVLNADDNANKGNAYVQMTNVTSNLGLINKMLGKDYGTKNAIPEKETGFSNRTMLLLIVAVVAYLVYTKRIKF